MGRNTRAGIAAYGLFAAAFVLATAASVWPFVVDDALIALRYASHVARGEGYRFNPPGHGAASLSSDGVTPLPWAFLLLPFTVFTPEHQWIAVKLLSLSATVVTAAVLARACIRERHSSRSRAAFLLAPIVFALSVPVAMYGVSGMETSVALLCVTLAFVAPARALPWLAGVSALFRPELAAWALPFALLAPERGAPDAAPRKRAAAVLVALLPFFVVAMVRLAVWGRPYPLALLAKPSDVSHGALYVLGACVFSGLPILILDRALFTHASRSRALVVAFCVYLASIALIGGDSMPFSRLVVPFIAPLILATYRASKHAAARFALLLVLDVGLLVRFAPTVRHVADDRRAWMQAARARFANAARVASVDVGWLGLAHEGPLLDLAGVTDLAVASRPGGHTSKSVDLAFLRASGVDVVLVLTGAERRITRSVEGQLVRDPRFREEYAEEETLPVGASGYTYRVFRRALSPAGTLPTDAK